MYNNPNFNNPNCRHNYPNGPNMNFNDDFPFKEHERRNCRHNNNKQDIEFKGHHKRENCRHRDSFNENDERFKCHGPFDELSDEEFKNFCHRRQKMFREMRKNGDFRGFGPRYMDEPRGKKQRLQPLSIRIKPHTKKFLKEDSVLSAREILELYEDFASGTEEYISSLEEDKKDLEDELSKIQEKLKSAKVFTEKLENTDENSKKEDKE